jgi:hypothetical protein
MGVFALQLLPQSEWLPAILLDVLVDSTSEDVDEEDDGFPKAPVTSTIADKLTSLRPTGRVVAVLERGWRDYVCTIVEDRVDGQDAAAQATDNEEAVLVVPMDMRWCLSNCSPVDA